MPKHICLLLSIPLVLGACKKDKEEDPAPDDHAHEHGTLAMSVAFMNGSASFNFATTYQDGATNNIRFDKIKFLISDIHVQDDAGTTVAEFQNRVLLVDASVGNSFTLGEIAAGHVHEAHFALGLDSAANGADPAAAVAPLDDTDMHATLGDPLARYNFLVMEGKVDGNNDGDFDDVEDESFTYPCFGNSLLRETHVHVHTNLTAGSTLTLAIKVDVGTLISGLDLLSTPTVTISDETVANTAMDSLVSAIDEL